MREWVNTVLTVVLMLALIPLTLWVKSINDDLIATQQQQAQSSRQFETFLRDFTAEANYECLIASERAKESDLPLPKPGTCNVVAP